MLAHEQVRSPLLCDVSHVVGTISEHLISARTCTQDIVRLPPGTLSDCAVPSLSEGPLPLRDRHPDYGGEDPLARRSDSARVATGPGRRRSLGSHRLCNTASVRYTVHQYASTVFVPARVCFGCASSLFVSENPASACR